MDLPHPLTQHSPKSVGPSKTHTGEGGSERKSGGAMTQELNLLLCLGSVEPWWEVVARQGQGHVDGYHDSSDRKLTRTQFCSGEQLRPGGSLPGESCLPG